MRFSPRVFRQSVAALVGGLLLALPGTAKAVSIYVIDSGVSFHSQVQNAENHLTTLGHTLTTGGTLADYSAYGQVWDLRYDGSLGAADVTAMGSYLAGGGRMYMTGEHSGFDASRNTSLVAFLSAIGAGGLTLADSGFSGFQPVTTAGQIVNSPNAFSSVSYAAARTVSNPGNGFLVTETSPGSGRGSLVGWDFGDLVGNPNARLLVGFDIEIFDNGSGWTEDMATYLGEPTPVPEPSTLLLLGSALVTLRGRSRFRRKRSS